MKENKNEEPKFFRILRIVAPCLLIVGVLLIVLSWTVFSKETWAGKDPSWGMFIPGVIAAFFSLPTFFMGFMPKLSKTMAKANIYITKGIQQENKRDLTDIANTTADISGEAITKTTRAIKKGFKDTKFCKHCGTEIDADSKFCNSCGGEQ